MKKDSAKSLRVFAIELAIYAVLSPLIFSWSCIFWAIGCTGSIRSIASFTQ